jgi:hypothetical protein
MLPLSKSQVKKGNLSFSFSFDVRVVCVAQNIIASSYERISKTGRKTRSTTLVYGSKKSARSFFRRRCQCAFSCPFPPLFCSHDPIPFFPLTFTMAQTMRITLFGTSCGTVILFLCLCVIFCGSSSICLELYSENSTERF